MLALLFLRAAEKGRRLGYMGHLIKILKHITNCISESEHIGALIENSLSDASELELWHSIVHPTDGDLSKALDTQSKMLAPDSNEYGDPLIENFLNDNNMWDHIVTACIKDVSGNVSFKRFNKLLKMFIILFLCTISLVSG